MSFAVPDKLSATEKAAALQGQGLKPATLEWAKKITQNDLDVIEGKARYNREAPKEEIEKLKLLKGHIQKDQFVTKFRKVFNKSEMENDLELVRAKIGDKDDDLEYYSILPTSPP